MEKEKEKKRKDGEESESINLSHSPSFSSSICHSLQDMISSIFPSILFDSHFPPFL